MKIYYKTLKGKRKTNQDSHTIFNNIDGSDKNKNDIILLGCYDGHGEEIKGKGDSISKFLSNNIPLIYGNKKNKYPFSNSFHYAVFDALKKKCLENKESYQSGSTCVLAIIYKINEILMLEVINLGDSRCIIINNDKTFEQITEDHNPSNLKEKKRIEKMGGVIIKDEFGTDRINGLSVSRGMGDFEITYISSKPDIFRKKINKNMNSLIIHCDGLVESMDNKAITNFIFKNKNTKKNIASLLCKKAYTEGSEDNISVILLKF